MNKIILIIAGLFEVGLASFLGKKIKGATTSDSYLWRSGFFICLLLLLSCKEEVHQVNFYYWKSRVDIGETEQKYFNALKSNKLYIRFFDVDIQQGEIKPLAKINLFNPEVLNAGYIPVIFITNRTFLGISQEEIGSLASNINDLIGQICRKNNISDINEIQVDCDWTEKTKSDYFRFLKNLQQTSQKEISCTIRLHQVKFHEKTGIPPVSKGYLMCYATSDPRESSVGNSILDLELLKDYTSQINSYPLDFDIALPIYSWGVVTNHLDKIKLINNVGIADTDTLPFQPKGKNLFEATDDFFFHGLYLNKGFSLRVETITPELLKEARQYLSEKIKMPYDIVYYHLDKAFLEQYKIEDL